MWCVVNENLSSRLRRRNVHRLTKPNVLTFYSHVLSSTPYAPTLSMRLGRILEAGATGNQMKQTVTLNNMMDFSGF